MALQAVLAPEEFEEDLEIRLGRANGNIFHRRPGVEGVHDGQVMVRLKKKRYVILDYSIIPSEQEVQTAQSIPHVTIPAGAGKTSCTNADCNKVGVPVLLYDSDPAEPPSLYMRSGLCFTCQRNLNEKRRTQRKRPCDANGGIVMGGGRTGISHDGLVTVFGSASVPKKYKLSAGAVVIHPLDGLRPHGDGYGFGEIGADLQAVMGDIANDTHRLLDAVTPHRHHHHHHHHDDSLHLEHHHPPPSASTDIAATAAAVAASVGVEVGSLAPVDDAATTAAMYVAHAAAAAAVQDNGKGNDEAVGMVPSTSEDINVLYDRAYRSMNKGMYLLFQWKQSWDSAIAAAVAQESVDHGLADAVASAAAVAAAASVDHHHGTDLLSASDADKKAAIKMEEDAVVLAAAEAAEAVAAVEAFEV